MNALDFCSQTFKSENLQKKLEEKVELLLNGVLRYKSGYQQEKAIKSFSEGLGYLESLLLFQRGIHMDQIRGKLETLNHKEYMDKMKEVEDIMQNEINRQVRHYTTFL